MFGKRRRKKREELTGLFSEHTWTLGEDERFALTRRLREAASWCLARTYPEDPAEVLRSPELSPPGYADIGDRWESPSLMRQRIRHVATERERLLRERGMPIVALDLALRSGRILGHDVPACTFDQIPNAASPLFDLQDNIGWDAWVDWLPEPGDPDREDAFMCLSWVPERLVPAVDGAMVSCTDCLVWIGPESLSLS